MLNHQLILRNTVSVLLIVAMVQLSMADDKTQTIRICGNRLIKALRSICVHGLASPKQRSQMMGSAASQRGIADACCVESCTIEYLHTYCQPNRTNEPSVFRRTGRPTTDALTYIDGHFRHHTHHHSRAIRMRGGGSAGAADMYSLLGLRSMADDSTDKKDSSSLRLM